MKDEFRFAAYGSETRDRIAQFALTRDPTLVAPILRGIVAYYLPKDGTVTVESVLAQPLTAVGLDSLTLMEITLDVEDAFGTTFADEELRGLASFAEIAELIDRKVNKLSAGEP